MSEKPKPISVRRQLTEGDRAIFSLIRLQPKSFLPDVGMNELREHGISQDTLILAKMILSVLYTPVVEDHLESNDSRRDDLNKYLEKTFGTSGVNLVSRNIFRVNILFSVSGPVSLLAYGGFFENPEQFIRLYELIDKRALDNRTYKPLPTRLKLKIIHQYLSVAKIALNLLLDREIPKREWDFITEGYRFRPFILKKYRYV